MLALLADENFNNDVVRGVRRRVPAIDIVRAQDVGLSGTDDSTVLEWAAENGRVILTHDVSTMTRYAYERVSNGLLMLGVFEVARHVPIGTAIDELVLIAECSQTGEWKDQVRYLPLR